MAHKAERRLRQTVFLWWRAPIWFLALFTGAKSFVDNPILGSRRLNRAGLHVARMKAAHALTRLRRRRIASAITPELRGQFDRDGFIVVNGALPLEDFRSLQAAILQGEFDCREQQQGDTITRRVALGPELRRSLPHLDRLLRSRRWRGLMAYVSASWAEPLYYIQTIFGGVASAPPDPQIELHSDTFHPSLKAWLFMTDVGPDDRPLTYVAGSHRLTDKRIEWEHSKSMSVLDRGDRLSKRGSFRISQTEIESLGLPSPTRFVVPANSLVIVDTCGFHARADSAKPTQRVELWAFCRRNPFIPWAAAGPFSSGPLAARQAQWLYTALDWLDRFGLRTQHWKPADKKNPLKR